MSRRTARKQAFFVLYQSDVNEVPVEATFERWRAYRGNLDEYAVRLAGGVEEEKDDLDALLAQVSVGWPVHRMSAVDRAILLALRTVDAGHGSGEEAPAFVGGVLRGAVDRVGVGHGETG